MKVHACTQGSDEWLWHRLGLPTASEFSRIITPAKGSLSSGIDGYIAELIAEQVAPDYSGGYTSRAMWEGTNIEADARDWYAYATGVEVAQVGFVTDDAARWGCSPDGLAADLGLELKGPTARVHVGYMLDPESLRAAYRVQCHGGMVVCERKRWDLVSYNPAFEPVIVTFEWDDYTDKVAAALVEFSKRYAEAVARFEEANGKPLTKPDKPRVRETPDPVFMP